MQRKNLILLGISSIATTIGVVSKINQMKFLGNIFLFLGLAIWAYLIVSFLCGYFKITKK